MLLPSCSSFGLKAINLLSWWVRTGLNLFCIKLRCSTKEARLCVLTCRHLQTRARGKGSGFDWWIGRKGGGAGNKQTMLTCAVVLGNCIYSDIIVVNSKSLILSKPGKSPIGFVFAVITCGTSRPLLPNRKAMFCQCGWPKNAILKYSSVFTTLHYSQNEFNTT